jgi:glutamyl-tRNA synthetase
LAMPQNAPSIISAAIPVLKPRAKTMLDLAAGSGFLFATVPLVMDEKAAGLLDDTGKSVVQMAHLALKDVSGWTLENIEKSIHALAELQQLGLGKIAQPLRAALTGTTTSPGIYDVLFLLGKSESLARLESAIGN